MRSKLIWYIRLHKYAEDGMSRKSIPDLHFPRLHFVALACLCAFFRHGLTLFLSFFLPRLAVVRQKKIKSLRLGYYKSRCYR